MRSFLVVLSLLMLLSFTGCGGSKEGRLPTYKFSGTVTYKGQPLEGADVIFHYTTINKSSFGRTNAAGEFDLGTYEGSDGALAGEASITITKWEQLPPSTAPIAGQPGYDPSQVDSSDKTPQLLVPERYTDTATSGLKTVVEANSRNLRLIIELQD